MPLDRDTLRPSEPGALASSVAIVQVAGEQGTAFFLSPTLLATAAHVVGATPAGQPVTVVFLRRTLEATVLDTRANTVEGAQRLPFPDIALIRLAEAAADARPLALVDAMPATGTTIYVRGFPVKGEAGEDAATTVEGQRSVTADQQRFRIKLARSQIAPGMSGAPAVLPSGRVAGVLTISRDDRSDLGGYFTPTRELVLAFGDAVTPFVVSDVVDMLPPAPSFFFGRSGALADLDRFTAERGAVAVTGLSGSGKSHLVLAFARRAAARHRGTFWLDARGPLELANACRSLLSTLGETRDGGDPQPVAAASVTAVVAALQRREDWLVVFDGVEDFTTLEPFIPTLSHGSMLITSTERVFDPLPVAHDVHLEGFSVDEARDFLAARTGRTTLDANEARAAETIADALDRLPLALEQVAAYLNAFRTASYQTYETALRERGSVRQLTKSRPKAGGAAVGIEHAVALNVEGLVRRPDGGEARALLDVLAFLAPGAVRLQLFATTAELPERIRSVLNELGDGKARAQELATVLASSSLVGLDESAERLWLHGIVGDVVRDALWGDDVKTPSVAYRDGVRRLVRWAVAALDLNETSDDAAIGQSLQHVERLDRWAHAATAESRELCTLLDRGAERLEERAEFSAEIGFLERALEIAPHADLSAEWRIRLGGAFGNLRDWKRANDTFLEAQRTLLGARGVTVPGGNDSPLDDQAVYAILRAISVPSDHGTAIFQVADRPWLFDLGRLLETMAGTLLAAGDMARAFAYVNGATVVAGVLLPLMEKPQAEHLVAGLTNTLASALMVIGNQTSAIGFLARVEDAPAIARTYTQARIKQRLAMLIGLTGRDDAGAERRYHDAIGMYEALLPRYWSSLVYARRDYALFLIERDRLDEGGAQLDEAQKGLDSGPEPDQIAHGLILLARAQLAARRGDTTAAKRAIADGFALLPQGQDGDYFAALRRLVKDGPDTLIALWRAAPAGAPTKP